jgi:hypothetical protein
MRLEEQERKSIEAKKRAEADEALRHVEEAVLIAGETQSRVLLGTSSGEAAVSNFDRVGVVDRLAQHAKPSYGSLRGKLNLTSTSSEASVVGSKIIRKSHV